MTVFLEFASWSVSDMRRLCELEKTMSEFQFSWPLQFLVNQQSMRIIDVMDPEDELLGESVSYNRGDEPWADLRPPSEYQHERYSSRPTNSRSDDRLYAAVACIFPQYYPTTEINPLTPRGLGNIDAWRITILCRVVSSSNTQRSLTTIRTSTGHIIMISHPSFASVVLCPRRTSR